MKYLYAVNLSLLARAPNLKKLPRGKKKLRLKGFRSSKKKKKKNALMKIIFYILRVCVRALRVRVDH